MNSRKASVKEYELETNGIQQLPAILKHNEIAEVMK